MRARTAKQGQVIEVPLEEGGSLPANAPDPEEELALRTRSQVLYRALGRLPDRERDAIVLGLIRGLRLPEVRVPR